MRGRGGHRGGPPSSAERHEWSRDFEDSMSEWSSDMQERARDMEFPSRMFNCARIQVEYEDLEGAIHTGTLHPRLEQAENFPEV